MVEMITGIDLSQEIFAINVLRTLISSLKHRRKHVLRSLQLYGDQALDKCRLRMPNLKKERVDKIWYLPPGVVPRRGKINFLP